MKFTFSVDGRPSGEAFVELSSAEDVEKALAHSHEHMGRRYVEIFRANRSQWEWDTRKEETVSGEGSGVVRLRGLPFGCTEEQIATFFSGLLDNFEVIIFTIILVFFCRVKYYTWWDNDSKRN